MELIVNTSTLYTELYLNAFGIFNTDFCLLYIYVPYFLNSSRAIINFEVKFAREYLSIFENINILEDLMILVDQYWNVHYFYINGYPGGEENFYLLLWGQFIQGNTVYSI